MEVKEGGIVVIHGDNIEAGGLKVVHQYGSGSSAPKKNEPLTEDELREKVESVRQHIGTIKRLWFPVCKYMMWHSMVGDGDFVTAVAILERLYPELHLDADDLSSLNVLSFSKPLKEWNPNDAPVKGTYFSKYFLIANLLGG